MKCYGISFQILLTYSTWLKSMPGNRCPEIDARASNAKWVQQFRRMKMPRPSKRASLKTIHPDAKLTQRPLFASVLVPQQRKYRPRAVHQSLPRPLNRQIAFFFKILIAAVSTVYSPIPAISTIARMMSTVLLIVASSSTS